MFFVLNVQKQIWASIQEAQQPSLKKNYKNILHLNSPSVLLNRQNTG